MNCPSCSGENDSQATFCQHCGARLMDDASAAQQAEADSTMPVPPATDEPPPTPRDRFRQAVAARQQNHTGEEQDVWSGSFSRLAMMGWWIFAGVLTLVALVVGVMTIEAGFWILLLALTIGWVALVAWYAYRRYSVHYYLTNQRFLHEKGILWRQTDRIELIDIDDVTFRQGPIERMFGVGTIHLSSSDRTHPQLDLPGIEGVKEVAGMIDDLRRQERHRRGLHIESV